MAEEKNISLTDEDRNLLNNLLDEISQQDYDYDDMKTTLERVEQNVDSTSADLNAARFRRTIQEKQMMYSRLRNETDLSSDSILMNTDDSALGSGVTFDATDQAALTEETNAETSDDETQNGLDFETQLQILIQMKTVISNEESTRARRMQQMMIPPKAKRPQVTMVL